MYRRHHRYYKHYIRYIKEKAIPFILIAGGIFLLLIFTPVWMWVVMLGALLIYCGLYILKKWR